MSITENTEIFAQQQTALYEQFLNSLQTFTLTTRQSGEEVTTKLMRVADSMYFENKATLEYYFYNAIDEIKPDEETFWTKKPLAELEALLTKCIHANNGTFKSALRFGGAFKGLSDYMSGMSGSMGYLVQKKAQEIHWKVRLRDGRSVTCTRVLYVALKHFANRAFIYKYLTEMPANADVTIEQLGSDQVVVYKAKDLLEDEELCESLFHVGSRYFIKEVVDVI